MSVVAGFKLKQPRNLKLTVALGTVFLVFFLVARWAGAWSPGRGFGLGFGVLAVILFVFEMAYPARRPRARPFGTARLWLQAHIYFGVLALFAVLIHTDFRWPHGGIGWWLLGLSVWTTVSGIAGVVLQKWIPAALAEGLRVEALYERIPELTDQLRDEADELVADASETLARFYQSDVRPALAGPSPSWAYLFDVRAGHQRALDSFENIARYVAKNEREQVENLQSIVTEKMELDAHYRLQGLLRHWLVLHVPPAALLMALTAAHIFSWFWY